MAVKKKTWTEKLNDSKDLPRVETASERMSRNFGTGTFVIPAPIEVDTIMKEVPKGKLITVNIIRDRLAKKHGTNFTCPITSGIFCWIAANAAEEAYAQGKRDITPWWRTLKSNGELNPKYPGGTDEQAARLMAEGHKIVPGKGTKPPTIKDWERKLVE